MLKESYVKNVLKQPKVQDKVNVEEKLCKKYFKKWLHECLCPAHKLCILFVFSVSDEEIHHWVAGPVAV